MNLLEMLKKDKLVLIAMHTLLGECARGLGVDLAGTVSGMCAQAGVNRSQVYEKRGRLACALETVDLPRPGRPRACGQQEDAGAQPCSLREQVYRYRLEHPGAVVTYPSGQARYSDGFKRYILDLADDWQGNPETFCRQVEVPYPTFRDWQKRDRKQRFRARPLPSKPVVPASASEAVRTIVEEYCTWEGSLRDFLKFAAARMRLPPAQIRRVLVICKLLPCKARKAPRYRGSTQRRTPGSILVTDGKGVDVVSTRTGQIRTYNWQAMVDQATACHTARVLTDMECAWGVRAAFEASCRFLGRAPLALVHDGKPIHQDAGLKSLVERTTVMIEATEGRAQNKAVVEGEFGKFEQQVGDIYLDDSHPETLRKSAVSEVVRAYIAGVNHAGRFEFDGKSRAEVLREACPPTDKDREFVERLHAGHDRKRRPSPLPTKRVARRLLDAGFARFAIEHLDPHRNLRQWLSTRFTPQAIRQALAIFGAERKKGRLRNSTAHRYLVKLIQNCQNDLDLRTQEWFLYEFARHEQQAWLQLLDNEYEQLAAEHAAPCRTRELIFRVSEAALYGSMILDRVFWEERLQRLLLLHPECVEPVCRHIRRHWEVDHSARFQLIDTILSWQCRLVPRGEA